MSMKSQKRKRNLERAKKDVKNAFYPLVAALFFLILGVVGLILNSHSLDEYNNSKDIRDVTAVITQANLQSDTGGTKLWDADLTYEVDGTEYRGSTTIKRNHPRIGDTVTVEVYQRPNGKYVIAEITDDFDLFITNIMLYASLALGAFLLVVGIFCLVTALRAVSELKAKIQPDAEADSTDQ